MIESENSPATGKALTTGREELVFQIDNNGNVYFQNATRSDCIDKDRDKQYVTNFISRTVFYTSDPKCSVMLDPGSKEGRVCQQFLEQHFGKKDESVIKFFEFLENTVSDKEKFEYCIKIIYKEQVGIPKSRFESNISYYLVIGLFDDYNLGNPIEKLFLQKVEKREDFETIISHEELSINLFHFSQLTRVKKFMEKAVKKESLFY